MLLPPYTEKLYNRYIEFEMRRILFIDPHMVASVKVRAHSIMYEIKFYKELF